MRRGGVRGFLPSVNGFRFGNAFPHGGYRYPAIPVPLLDRVVRLDAGDGVCGGLVFALLDLIHSASLPTRSAELPSADSALFRYLVARQRASVVAVDRRTWMTNGGKTVLWALLRGNGGPNDVRRSASIAEWAAIRADLDAGRPSPVFLVAGPRCRFWDVRALIDTLRHSHQVLAYAYDEADDGLVTLRIADPNDPGDDASTLVFGTGRRRNAPLNAPAAEAILGRPGCFRGFFRAAYHAADPRAAVV